MSRWLALAAALAIGAFASFATAHAEQQHDYCAIGDQRTLFFVDATTVYDDNDRRQIRASLIRAIDALGPGDRLTVQTISSHYSLSEQVFDACRPGCGPPRNLRDRVGLGCSRMRAMQDERAFRAQLLREVVPLMNNTTELARSDIAGTIARVSQTFARTRRYDEVIVFSDMLENSQTLPISRLRTMAREEALAAVRANQLTPNVRGATVRIFGYGRWHSPDRPPLQPEIDERLRVFWDSYFRLGGAESVLFETAIT